MGTYARFVVEAPTRETGLENLDQMVSSIESSEEELSTWRESSTFSHLNQSVIGEAMVLPALSCWVMTRSVHWWKQTEGAFDPTLGNLIQENLKTPNPLRRSSQATDLEDQPNGLQWIGFDDEACAATRLKPVVFDLGGIGKGAALQAMSQGVLGDIETWLVDFGGQVAVEGGPWPVSIANPFDSTSVAFKLTLAQGSLATSATFPRGTESQQITKVHILDPHTKQPIDFHGSVSAWHQNALDADALATALMVMGLEKGLAWATKSSASALFLTQDHGGKLVVRATPDFEMQFQSASTSAR